MIRGPRPTFADQGPLARLLFFKFQEEFVIWKVATLQLLLGTWKLSSGKILAHEVLIQVRYLKLQFYLADQWPHSVQTEKNCKKRSSVYGASAHNKFFKTFI